MPISPIRSITTKVWGLSFDGVDDYVEVPHSPSIALNDEMTFLCWHKPLQPEKWAAGIANKYDIYTWGWTFFYNSARYLQLRLREDESIVGPIIPEWGRWYQMGVSVKRVDDTSEVTFYLNAEPTVKTSNYVLVDEPNKPLRIGYRHSTAEPLKGDIALVLLYNRVLSESEIQDIYRGYVTLDGLVLWLWANEILASGNVWRDRSGYGNHGAIYGAVWTETPIVAYAKPTRLIAQTRLISPTR